MMLRPESADSLVARFEDEAAAIKAMGFKATKMKVGLGPKDDIRLIEAVRKGVGDDYRFMVDANHAYTTHDAFYVGRAMEEFDPYWFEEPVAPEDYDGYRELRQGLNVNISGGEIEFNRWGWRALLEARGLDIAQPEVCALGGISEYLRVFTEVLTRYVFFTTIPEIQFIVPFCFLWMVMFATAIAVRRGTHFEVDLVQKKLRGVARKYHRYAMLLTVAAGGLIIAWSSTSFVELGMLRKNPATGIRMVYIYASITIGGLLITLMALEQLFADHDDTTSGFDDLLEANKAEITAEDLK